MEDKRDSKRRKYLRPEVKKVKLDSSVLLAKGCKFSASTGKSGSICRTTGNCRNNVHGS